MRFKRSRLFAGFHKSRLGLLICLLRGILLSVLRNNIFLVWVGLELNMFGIIPFINSNPTQTKNILFLNTGEVSSPFYYFLVQVIGSLFFAWGFILRDWVTIRVIGLLIKLGVTPFFWWVPAIFSRLDWLSIGILRTLQKVPSLLMFRILFDLRLSLSCLIALRGFLIRTIGIKFSSKKLKQLIAWSSVRKMRILLVLMVSKGSFGVTYYLVYRVVSLLFCYLLALKEDDLICGSFLKGEKFPKNILVGSILLILSGLPPFAGFLIKVYFLRGLMVKDRCALLEDIALKGNRVSFFAFHGRYLKRWNIVLLFLFLIIIQAVGYIKAFIQLNSTGTSRLSRMIHKYSLTSSVAKIRILLIYLRRVILIWL